MKQFANPLLLAAMTFAFCSPVIAQSQNAYAEQKAEITNVKRNPDKYVYAEVTCKTLDEAKAAAEEMFYENVNEYVAELKKEKGKNDYVISDAKSISNQVSMPRGSNMHRFFLYAKKSDIISVKNPVVLSSVRTQGEAATAVAESSQPEQPLLEFPSAAKQLAALHDISEANTKLKQMKANGVVTAYSKYAAVTNKEEWYLIVYDAKGTIKAVLTEGAVRYNVATGMVDSLSNYPHHVAFAVKLKK